jgi:hypothetical protein
VRYAAAFERHKLRLERDAALLRAERAEDERDAARQETDCERHNAIDAEERVKELEKHLEEADLRNKLLLKTNNDRAEELEEADEREQRLREALRWIETRDYYPPEAEPVLMAVQRHARAALSQQEPEG